MNIPAASVKELLEAGVHLGHKTFRWNPKMKKFIFGEKNSIHIIDLLQTVKLLNNAMLEMHKCVASGGKILFVSTKKQASELIAEVAKETGQFFVNHRWPGGMLTNWKTISNSIRRLKKLTEELNKENKGFTKKELIKMSLERDKLNRSLGGIADMRGKTILDAKQNIKIVEPVEDEKPKKAAKESPKIKVKKDSENKEEALKN